MRMKYLLNNIIMIDLIIILSIVIFPFMFIKWKREPYLTKYQRKDLAEKYSVLKTKTMRPRIDYKRWDWISQQILRIGGFYGAVEWLIDNSFDADIVITGTKGLGKTSVMITLSVKFSKRRGVNFTVKRNLKTGRIVILTPELITDDFDEYEIIAIDELQHAFHKMRATSTANVEANRFMDLKRKWKLNIIGTMPRITSVDKDLVNEKIVFWINCWYISKKRKIVKTIVHVNLSSKDGKYRDFIKLGEMTFPFCDREIYEAATLKWDKEQTDVRNLEDIKQRLARQIKIKRTKQTREDIQKIVAYKFLTLEEKCYLFLDMELNKIKIPNYLKKARREGTYRRIKKVDYDSIKLNKDFIYKCDSALDVDFDLIDNTTDKILHHLEKKERETQ